MGIVFRKREKQGELKRGAGWNPKALRPAM
jgi:hypothetical protein